MYALRDAVGDAAYRHHVDGIGTLPGPMRDDYAAAVRDRRVLVATPSDGPGTLAGVPVLDVTDEGFLLDDVAVCPDHQGRASGTCCSTGPRPRPGRPASTRSTCTPTS